MLPSLTSNYSASSNNIIATSATAASPTNSLKANNNNNKQIDCQIDYIALNINNNSSNNLPTQTSTALSNQQQLLINSNSNTNHLNGGPAIQITVPIAPSMPISSAQRSQSPIFPNRRERRYSSTGSASNNSFRSYKSNSGLSNSDSASLSSLTQGNSYRDESMIIHEDAAEGNINNNNATASNSNLNADFNNNNNNQPSHHYLHHNYSHLFSNQQQQQQNQQQQQLQFQLLIQQLQQLQSQQKQTISQLLQIRKLPEKWCDLNLSLNNEQLCKELSNIINEIHSDIPSLPSSSTMNSITPKFHMNDSSSNLSLNSTTNINTASVSNLLSYDSQLQNHSPIISVASHLNLHSGNPNINGGGMSHNASTPTTSNSLRSYNGSGSSNKSSSSIGKSCNSNFGSYSSELFDIQNLNNNNNNNFEYQCINDNYNDNIISIDEFISRIQSPIIRQTIERLNLPINAPSLGRNQVKHIAGILLEYIEGNNDTFKLSSKLKQQQQQFGGNDVEISEITRKELINGLSEEFIVWDLALCDIVRQVWAQNVGRGMLLEQVRMRNTQIVVALRDICVIQSSKLEICQFQLEQVTNNRNRNSFDNDGMRRFSVELETEYQLLKDNFEVEVKRRVKMELEKEKEREREREHDNKSTPPTMTLAGLQQLQLQSSLVRRDRERSNSSTSTSASTKEKQPQQEQKERDISTTLDSLRQIQRAINLLAKETVFVFDNMENAENGKEIADDVNLPNGYENREQHCHLFLEKIKKAVSTLQSIKKNVENRMELPETHEDHPAIQIQMEKIEKLEESTQTDNLNMNFNALAEINNSNRKSPASPSSSLLSSPLSVQSNNLMLASSGDESESIELISTNNNNNSYFEEKAGKEFMRTQDQTQPSDIFFSEAFSFQFDSPVIQLDYNDNMKKSNNNNFSLSGNSNNSSNNNNNNNGRQRSLSSQRSSSLIRDILQSQHEKSLLLRNNSKSDSFAFDLQNNNNSSDCCHSNQNNNNIIEEAEEELENDIDNLNSSTSLTESNIL